MCVVGLGVSGSLGRGRGEHTHASWNTQSHTYTQSHTVTHTVTHTQSLSHTHTQSHTHTHTRTQDVKPGKARVIKCLMENMAQPNFGEECKSELQQREDVMKSDYRCVR